jgi:hypothetical protein
MKMITQFLLTSLLTAGSVALLQTDSKAQAGNNLNIGIGLGSTFIASGLDASLPPLSISYEHAFGEKISAGGFLGYAGASKEATAIGGTWKWKYSYILVGARAAYHFNFKVPKLDPYAGLMAGYNVGRVSTEKPTGYTGPDIAGAKAGGAVIGGYLGARYMLADRVGAFAELGYGIAYLTLGVTLKM